MWESILESTDNDWLRNDAARRLMQLDAADFVDQVQREVDRARAAGVDASGWEALVRAGVLRESDLPSEAIAVLGDTGSHRIDALVHDLVESSDAAQEIVQGSAAAAAMNELRDFMFANVYLGPRQNAEQSKIDRLLRTLFDHYVSDPTNIPDGGGAPSTELGQRVVDYLAGMTDRYAVRVFEDLSVPDSFAL